MMSSASTESPASQPPGGGHARTPHSATTRERTAHAVEYYNSNVLRARVGAGLAARSSVNERHLQNGRHHQQQQQQQPHHQQQQQQHHVSSIINRLYPENLYRSNSSLELVHESTGHPPGTTAASSGGVHLAGPNLRREYGSHGSIDVIANDRPHGASGTSESFFAMLQDYRPAVLGVIGTDQRSPGPAEYMKGKVPDSGNYSSAANTSASQANVSHYSNGGGLTNGLQTSSSTASMQNYTNEATADDRLDAGSPKFKLHRLWGPTKAGRQPTHVSANDECSFITTLSADIEERQRRRAFAHFDCQSLTANLGYAAKLRGLLLARRRNTTTGASAASMVTSRDSSSAAASDSDSIDDFGDGQGNELLDNCPFFRNEIGGEDEREVSLTRFHSSNGQKRAIHRPALACGVSVLECPAGDSLWKQATCPFQRGIRPIESVDNGARYYRDYFLGQEHQNWFGMDEQLGPVAISIKREKIGNAASNGSSSSLPEGTNKDGGIYQFRMIVRTSELLTLRGSVLEDSVPNPRGPGKAATTKDVLEYVAPEVQIATLKQGVNTPQCEQQLLKLDEQGLTNKYKVGILYCKAGQGTEEDMYNNEDAGPAFNEFLDTVGKRVRLKGFEHYKAGLDNKTDSTGTHSLYATLQDCEVMFHVSTMLPFTPNNRQQLLRKRHIGNDIVTIVFQEPGSLPFTPKNIRSQFQHVFVIVRAVNPCTDNTHYRVAVSRSKEVPVFGPPIRAGALFLRSKSFADFLVSKVINAENAAHRSEKFATMATRTRQEYLKDLANNYCSTTMVDTGPKFSIFPSKKKERPKPKFNGDITQRGAFCWQVVLHDTGQAASVDCFLGISAETFVLIEECSRQIVFVTPCKAVLGWWSSGYTIRIYHHQSECITLSMRESTQPDELVEVIERLRAVTSGCGANELNLRRNPMGQLGFHVQPDGVVTQVEKSGQAWTAGLRQGYRLVEICKVAVATLSHDEMVDLLKTSTQVTVTVIESFPDHTYRRGCFLQNCKFNIVNYESIPAGGGNPVGGNAANAEYENLEDKPKHSTKTAATAQLKQANGASHRIRYERSFSPPRSSNSSGYGTGSSSRSFNMPNEHVRLVTDMGTLTSSSSGHSSTDDRWYDILEVPDNQENASNDPQPQPPAIHHHSQPQYHHPKISHTSSLPLVNAIRPLSIHEPTDASGHHPHPKTSRMHHPQSTSNHPSLLGKVTTVNEQRPLPRTANIEYLIKPPTVLTSNYSTAGATSNGSNGRSEGLYSKAAQPDGNHTDNGSMNNEPLYSVSLKSVKSVSTIDDEVAATVPAAGHGEMLPLRRASTTSNIHKHKSGKQSSQMSLPSY